MNDLVDRYVWAVAKDLPADAREDVARELRATIEDMVEARGQASDETIREVLVELGDPAQLALRYSGRKRYLIGPAVYPFYARLLKTLITIIVPIVLAATLFDRLQTEDSVIIGILGALNAGLLAGIMVSFWVTFVFAVLERADVRPNQPRAGGSEAWSPDTLPQVIEKRQIRLTETIFSVVALSLLLVAALWLRSHSGMHLPTDAGSGSIPFLDANLWAFWMPVFIATIAASMATEIWKYVSGYWTLPLVVANLVVNALFSGVVIAILATQTVISPAFLAAFSDQTGSEFPIGVVGTAFLVLVLGTCVADGIEGVIKHLRLRRALQARRLTGGAG